MTLSQFFRHVYCRRRYLSDSATLTYWAAIRTFQRWNTKPILLSKLSADLLRGFLVASKQNEAPATVNQKRSTLLTIWRFAYRWDYCPTHAPETHEIPKLPVPKRTPTAWTVEEFGRILVACQVARPIKRNGTLWDERHWRALFLTIYDTGERLDALLHTDRCDLSHTGHLTIRGEHRKGKRRDIVRKLHAQTLAAIEALPPHRLLFPWPLTKRTIFMKLDPILHAAGVPTGRRWKFHCGRRMSATQVAVSLGIAAASKHLDHSSIQLTVDSYIDPRQLPDMDVSDVISRPDLW